MPYITAVVQNAFTWLIQGELDLTAGAAVSAIRGDNLTATKTGTGTYQVVLKNTQALQLVETLNRDANFTQTLPATATGVTLTTVTQSASTGDITITLVTTLNPTTGAATDTTAATTISFGVLVRIGRLGTPL